MEHKTFYFPIRGERYVPSMHHALAEILNCILNAKPIRIYTTKEFAEEAGRNMLFDDDTFAIFEVELSACVSIHERDFRNNEIKRHHCFAKDKIWRYFGIVK